MALVLAGCGSAIDLPVVPPPPPASPPPPPAPTPVATVASPVLVGVPWNLKLTVANAAEGVALTWNLVNSAQSYWIEWQSDPEVVTLPTSPPTDRVELSGLRQDLRYRYTATVGNQQTVLSAVPRAAGTNAPTTVSIRPDISANELSWSAIPNATAYRVYWSFTSTRRPQDGTRIDVGPDGNTIPTRYTHTGLERGAPYYYAITAVLPDGSESGASAEVQADPGQPASVTATVSEGLVAIAWTDESPTAITAATSQVLVASASPTFPVTVTDIENDHRYAIWVRPLFAGGLGPSSSTVYATPKTTSTGVPKNIVIETGRGVNALSWDAVARASTYDVSWVAQDIDGHPLPGTVTVTETVSDTRFRHAGLPLCITPPACPTYAYQVRVSPSGGIAAEVAAQVVDLRPVPPLITNTSSMLITGLKPSMSRVEINGIVAVPLNHETGWSATLLLNGIDRLYPFQFVAVNADGLASTMTTLQVARDTVAPTPPTNVTLTSCDPETTSPRHIKLSGTKDSGSAVFRLREPDAPDQQITGATDETAWSGALDLDDQPPSISLIAKDAAGNVSTIGLPITLPTGPCI